MPDEENEYRGRSPFEVIYDNLIRRFGTAIIGSPNDEISMEDLELELTDDRRELGRIHRQDGTIRIHYTNGDIEEVRNSMPEGYRWENDSTSSWSSHTTYPSLQEQVSAPVVSRCYICKVINDEKFFKRLTTGKLICPQCKKRWDYALKLIRVYHGYSNPIKYMVAHASYLNSCKYKRISRIESFHCHTCNKSHSRGYTYIVENPLTYIYICGTCQPYFTYLLNEFRQEKYIHIFNRIIGHIRDYRLDTKEKKIFMIEGKEISKGQRIYGR